MGRSKIILAPKLKDTRPNCSLATVPIRLYTQRYNSNNIGDLLFTSNMPHFRHITLIVAAVLLITAMPAEPARADIRQQTINIEAARDQILNGVSTLANPTQPGKMVVFGDNAYSIANYKDQDLRDPMLAAAEWGDGKVLAMADHQWLNMDNYGDLDDTGALYRNSIAWLTGTTTHTIKIVVTPSTSAVAWLAQEGFTNVVQSSDYATELADADLLIGWLGSSVSQADLDTISTFVTSGGSLFIVDYGVGYDWWWNTDLPDSPGNKLLRAAGIGFSGDWPNGTLEVTRASGQITAQNVIDMLDDPSNFTATELEIGGAVLTRMYQVLPDNDPLVAQLDTAYSQRINQLNPTSLTPISDSFDKALLTREALILDATPPQQVTPHRLAETLYGTVPVTATRVTQTVSIDTSNSRWQPTGLFVSPGEVVTVTVPATLVDLGYKIRVNAHSDNISPRGNWERPPIVHRWFPITQTTTAVANGFGGLLFIDLGSTPPDIGTVEIQIQNAVEAPYFVLGQHSDQEWRDSLRSRPAPFGLLVSENMITALPKHQIESADLTEPTALMTWWNQSVILQSDLADQTQFRTSAELANIDVQISAGAAHSGYPYQAYEKHWGNMADWDRLRTQGSWGDFHELGHNHQRGWWTFDGDVEVTVNIFSNYLLETLAEAPSGGWAWSADPVQVIQEAINNVSGGGTYASKSNRWSFWFQLADGFGWDAYHQTFRQYEVDNANNPSLLPTTNQEEKDQWFVRFSQQVGYDMSCFMVDTWGLQVTQSAKDSVSHLPCWLPVMGGNLDTIIPINSSHTVDITGAALAMDSAVTVTAVSAPTSGTLTDNTDGTWTFAAAPGKLGQSTFTYTLQSSVSNTQDFTVTTTITNQGVLMETWFNIGGSAVADLTNNAAYPQNPDERTVITAFETASNRAESFGSRLRTWVRPPTSGDYTFWTASDDASILLLSSDDAAENAVQIAQVSGYTSAQNWNQSSEQESAAIPLIGGRYYYIEAIIKEGGGGDHLAIAWQGPNIDQQVIASQYLTIYDESGGAPTAALGDTNCDDAVNVIDGLYMLQYTALMRTSYGGCPLAEPSTQINVTASDIDEDGEIDAVDALFLMQCEVAIDNPYCNELAEDTPQATFATNERSHDGDGAVEIFTIQSGQTHSIQMNTDALTLATPNVAAGTFEVTYERAQSQVVGCSVTANGPCNIATPGVVRFSFVNLNGLQGEHEVVELTFENSDATITGITATTLVNSQGQRLAYNVTLETSNQLYLPFMQ